MNILLGPWFCWVQHEYFIIYFLSHGSVGRFYCYNKYEMLNVIHRFNAIDSNRAFRRGLFNNLQIVQTVLD